MYFRIHEFVISMKVLVNYEMKYACNYQLFVALRS